MMPTVLPCVGVICPDWPPCDAQWPSSGLDTLLDTQTRWGWLLQNDVLAAGMRWVSLTHSKACRAAALWCWQPRLTESVAPPLATNSPADTDAPTLQVVAQSTCNCSSAVLRQLVPVVQVQGLASWL